MKYISNQYLTCSWNNNSFYYLIQWIIVYTVSVYDCIFFVIIPSCTVDILPGVLSFEHRSRHYFSTGILYFSTSTLLTFVSKYSFLGGGVAVLCKMLQTYQIFLSGQEARGEEPAINSSLRTTVLQVSLILNINNFFLKDFFILPLLLKDLIV